MNILLLSVQTWRDRLLSIGLICFPKPIHCNQRTIAATQMNRLIERENWILLFSFALKSVIFTLIGLIGNCLVDD